MKSIYLFFVIGLLFTCSASAQMRSGTVTDRDGEPIAYATVFMLTGENQAAVAVTDSIGKFSVSVADGEYVIKARHLVYKPLEQKITISQTADLGIFKLEDLDVDLDEVVVTAHTLTHENGRFVMRMNNTPLTLNKDATEVLQLAPGVWVDDNGVSVNGTSGTKIFINDRELRLTGKELTDYLRNFRSSDIARVEVIPQAGAEYSADSRGGVLKIILRKQLENGVSGNLKFATSQGRYNEDYAPSASLNTHIGRWTLNAFASDLNVQKGKGEIEATRSYLTNTTDEYNSLSHLNQKSNSGLGRLGAIYEMNKMNSLGIEAEYSAKKLRTPSYADAVLSTDGIIVNSQSNYLQKETDRDFSATFNYVHKFDTLGTTLKLITDYTNKKVTGDNNYQSAFDSQNTTWDSLYRNNSSSNYKIFTTDLAFNKQLPNGMKYTVGAKYTRNDMTDTVCYESQNLSIWNLLPKYSYSLDYTEDISAVYSTFTADFGHLNLVAGLRGEYTYTVGKNGSDVHKSYFDLFPSVNATYSFDPMRMFMLIGQYSRNIERPNFWYLNPNRVQYSDYSYYIGNPELRPTYINKFGLTAVYHYRYILSIGGNLHHDLIREVCKTDPSNPNVTYIQPENHHTENHYYVAISTPFKVAKWWNVNLNLVGVKQDIRGTETDSRMSHYLYFSNVTTGFNLPSKFYLELTYSGTSRLYSANSGIDPRSLFHASLKKQFFNDRLTASIGVNNLFNSRASYFSNMDDFTIHTKAYESGSARCFKFSLQYSFNAGKAFKSRSVESASDTEKSRLKKSSGTK